MTAIQPTDKVMLIISIHDFVQTDYVRILHQHGLDRLFLEHVNPSLYLHYLFCDVSSSIDCNLASYLEDVLPAQVLDNTDVLNDIFIASEVMIDAFEHYIDRYYSHPGEYYAFQSVKVLPDGSLALLNIDL